MEEKKKSYKFQQKIKQKNKIKTKTIVVIIAKTIKIIKLSRGRNIQKH